MSHLPPGSRFSIYEAELWGIRQRWRWGTTQSHARLLLGKPGLYACKECFGAGPWQILWVNGMHIALNIPKQWMPELLLPTLRPLPHHSGTSVLRSLCSSLESHLPVDAACNGICQTRTSLKREKEGESTPFTPVSNFSTVTFCVFLSTCICDLTSPLWSKHHTYPCPSSPLLCSGTFPSAASLVFWISAHLSPSPSKPFPYF